MVKGAKGLPNCGRLKCACVCARACTQVGRTQAMASLCQSQGCEQKPTLDLDSFSLVTSRALVRESEDSGSS